MGISFSRAVVFELALPMIQDVIADAIKSGSVGESCKAIKQDLINTIMDMTGKTHFSWDDHLAKALIDYLIDSDAADKLAITLMDCVEKWVEETETKWDDKAVLPVIVAFRSVVNVEARV